MGLSSSQARLLHLTSRMHQIEYKAQRLEAEKLQMANESDRVYEEYLDALDATKIQYSTLTTDGAITYLDATYNNLCMGYISNGSAFPQSSGYYLGAEPVGDSAIIGKTTGRGYQLVDSETGAVYVPEYVKNIYNNSADATEFANKMVEYVNGNASVAVDTTTSGENDTVSPGNETIPADDQSSYELTRGQTLSNISIKAGEQKTIILKNTFDNGKDYEYTFKAKSNDTNVTLSYNLNGRLVITGNELDITASRGQADDIILLGDNNNISTGDGNDTIRSGFARDMGLVGQSNGNNINAGAGDDYIQVFGNTTIKGGSGDDDLLVHGTGDYSNDNVENIFHDMQTQSNFDTKLGWTMQANFGNCRGLSLINSMGNSINDFVTVSQDGDGYKVVFSRSGQSVKVTDGDIKEEYTNESGKAACAEYGDLDNIIIERALNKVVLNKTGKTLETCDYNTISDVLFGNTEVYHTNALFVNKEDEEAANNSGKITIRELLKAQEDGEISNFIVGTGSKEDVMNGIIANHAYAVKGVGDNYVELVNPWDNNDSIKLDAATFSKYFEHVFVFGQVEGTYKGNGIYHNGAGTSTEENITLNANPVNAPYQYYIDLYDLLTSSGMNAIPAGMENSAVWLANVIQAGAVLKMQDSNNNWIDTSVATNTRLQEVSDTTLIKKAEAKYEADMKKIDRKERKYDADLATFDNERNAIKQEMDTLKTVAKENVERTFKLFS